MEGEDTRRGAVEEGRIRAAIEAWTSGRGPALTAVALAGLFAGLHLAAIGTENINWDEFALLQRTATLVRTGVLSGGRPGAADQILAPLVRGCVDAVATVRAARWLWATFTLAALGGFFALLRLARDGRPRPWTGAAWGVALLALLPAFLRWSLQVRTDQGALVFGLWGGVALLASRRNLPLALLAGVGFGAGFLFTQKLAYVAALCGVLMAGDLARPRTDLQAEARRFVARGLAAAIGAALVFVAYRALAPGADSLPSLMPVTSGLRTFAHYRQLFGFVVYRGMLPTLAPHIVLLALFAVASIRAARERRWTSPLTIAWTVLVAGASVAIFHAGAFPYFWMTLGLFPATAVALAWEEIVDVLPSPVRGTAMLALSLLLVVPAVRYSLGLLEDTQAPQRQALGFIERNFPPGASGLQLEGALFCRADPDPFPVLFREHVNRLFTGPDTPQHVASFIAEFRRKETRFLISSHVMPYFPAPVQKFWLSHYLPYFGQVWVLGRTLDDTPDHAQVVDLLATATYRWFTTADNDVPSISVDGVPLAAGDTIPLAAGEHEIRFLLPGTSGILSLALDDPPSPGGEPFYSLAPRLEITGTGW